MMILTFKQHGYAICHVSACALMHTVGQCKGSGLLGVVVCIGDWIPLSLQVTGAHFDDLKQRYGHPLVVLNLLKSREKRGREVVLRRELAAAVNLLNAQVGALSKYDLC